MSILKSLQEKPPSVKARYAFVTAFVITLVIAGVWTTTIPARFAAISEGVGSSEVKTATVGKGIDTLLQGINDIVEEIPPEETSNAVSGDQMPRGALGALGDWNVTSTPEISQPIVDETSISHPPTDHVLGSSTLSVSETPETAQKPTVILIGTTTVKKSE